MLFEKVFGQGDVKGKRVLVVGFGVDAGESAARFFVGRGCVVEVCDLRPENEFSPLTVAALRALGVSFQFGVAEATGVYHVVIRSPGIPPNAQVIKKYLDAGVPVTSSTRIFLALFPGVIIGVTGTKGKGTCASLITAMLQASGIEAVLGGNIGTPMLDLLPHARASTIAVLELSSFQLIDIEESPHIAVLLMTTEDHLDFHGTTAEYLEAKAKIVTYQQTDDFLVYNSDYSNVLRLVQGAHAKRFEVSSNHAVQNGCFSDENTIFIAKNGARDAIAAIADIQLPGRHNRENVCAAIMAARCAGATGVGIVAGLRGFKGLEHRLELVREVNGVKYYNDSFATNPPSTIAAIRAFDAPEVLILGGSPKGNDFSGLAQVIVE